MFAHVTYNQIPFKLRCELVKQKTMLRRRKQNCALSLACIAGKAYTRAETLSYFLHDLSITI